MRASGIPYTSIEGIRQTVDDPESIFVKLAVESNCLQDKTDRYRAKRFKMPEHIYSTMVEEEVRKPDNQRIEVIDAIKPNAFPQVHMWNAQGQ